MSNEQENTERWEAFETELDKKLQKRSRATEATRDNGEKARDWVDRILASVLKGLMKNLGKRKEITGIRLEGYHKFGKILKFQVSMDAAVPANLSYTISLEVSSQGIMGKTQFSLPNQEPYIAEHKSILDWGEEEIRKDFMKGFNSWQV